jgi:hypothetical protein
MIQWIDPTYLLQYIDSVLDNIEMVEVVFNTLWICNHLLMGVSVVPEIV